MASRLSNSVQPIPIIRSVSHTTRKPRPKEKNGVDYNFTTTDAIKKDIAANKFIEVSNHIPMNTWSISYSADELTLFICLFVLFVLFGFFFVFFFFFFFFFYFFFFCFFFFVFFVLFCFVLFCFVFYFVCVCVL